MCILFWLIKKLGFVFGVGNLGHLVLEKKIANVYYNQVFVSYVVSYKANHTLTYVHYFIYLYVVINSLF